MELVTRRTSSLTLNLKNTLTLIVYKKVLYMRTYSIMDHDHLYCNQILYFVKLRATCKVPIYTKRIPINPSIKKIN